MIPSFLSINQMMDVCPKCLARSAVYEAVARPLHRAKKKRKCFWCICKQCLINHRSIDASIRNQANDAHLALAQTKAFFLKGNIFIFMDASNLLQSKENFFLQTWDLSRSLFVLPNSHSKAKRNTL